MPLTDRLLRDMQLPSNLPLGVRDVFEVNVVDQYLILHRQGIQLTVKRFLQELRRT